MSDTAFTDLEEELFGANGTEVLRQTASRLIALRDKLRAQMDAGLPPHDATRATLTLAATDAAERIVIDLKSRGV